MIAAVLALAGAACGFEFLVSDSATRIAYALRNGAARLTLTRGDTLIIGVDWRSWPDGCPGSYRVQFVADSDRYPRLGVRCTSGPRSYGTTYYRSFVRVPKSLDVSHEKDQPTTITLRKAADGAIEVIALR